MRASDFDLFFAPSLSMSASSEVHSVVRVEPGRQTEALFKVRRQTARRCLPRSFFTRVPLHC